MYYKKVNDEILLTELGHYVLSFFGLTIEDLKVMSKQQLIEHTKKFSDVLNDLTNHKSGKMRAGIKRSNLEGYTADMPEYTLNETIGDSGSYSRYFDLDKWFNAQKTFPFLIVPKASKSEKNKGCEELPEKIQNTMTNSWKDQSNYLCSDGRYRKNSMPGQTLKSNHHPTVKPLKLFSYLITMGSRENDLILDPFCGSGTTLIAAHNIHRKCIGIEINQDYLEIAKHRLTPYIKQTRLES